MFSKLIMFVMIKAFARGVKRLSTIKVVELAFFTMKLKKSQHRLPSAHDSHYAGFTDGFTVADG
jgi:hypothetical protein